ncbi:CRISPR-associated helicase Cas3' [Sporosarcina sp. USHLN248]|uniref:CRISPR-associated helicase Cas3' n=1 Tax=Sporosarcina sp. USHLN248 TaxID=3081300 RepID=UPI0030198859
MEYIAHIRESDGEVQTVETHLREVQELAERFGEKIGAKHLAGLAGLLHDMGKLTEQFRNYIIEAVNNPNNPPARGTVDHSTAGGKYLYQYFHQVENATPLEKVAVEWVAMSILSHHSGLRDFISDKLSSPFLERVIYKDIKEFDLAVTAFLESYISISEYFNEAVREINDLLQKRKKEGLQAISLSLLIKFIFSCLIDADRTNTMMFEENRLEEVPFDSHQFFKESYEIFMDNINLLKQNADLNLPINILRSSMSEQCETIAYKPSGIYTLSIPTGGGKTLSSIRYALRHAIEYRKDRIIYIVPYTTIIEQNAEEVRKYIRNEDAVLEHHSNILEEEKFDSEEEAEKYHVKQKKQKLLRDNWGDSPIVFTTMVQFLNVFYSGGTRNIRRLHNLANSILVFDEVQSVPIKCVSLFNEALNFLKSYCNTSIILCTATQPALDFVENKLKIPHDAEIIKNINEVSKHFKRVNIIDKTDEHGLQANELRDFVLKEMESVDSLLVILNTKTAVKKLYEEIRDSNIDFELYHLSTNMCPAHRKVKFEDLKNRLKSGKRLVCVSSQLIEAGVDISFQCVIRSLAGLDSIAQAAGRCNRHGEDDIRIVYIIKSADEVVSNLKDIKIGGEQTARVLYEFKRDPSRYGNDLLSPEAMKLYFSYYYTAISNELNYPIAKIGQNGFDLINLNQNYFQAYKSKHSKKLEIFSRQAFATMEKHFKVIDSPTTSVLVPYNKEAKEIIAELNGEMDLRDMNYLLRKAQQYVVNIYKPEMDRLEIDGYIDYLLHGEIYALKETAYSVEWGIGL